LLGLDSYVLVEFFLPSHILVVLFRFLLSLTSFILLNLHSQLFPILVLDFLLS
jgi:hypothetical protein